DLLKAPEKRGLVFARDADARVAHRELETPALGAHPDRDRAAFGRELERVAQQVQDDLFELLSVERRDEGQGGPLVGEAQAARLPAAAGRTPSTGARTASSPPTVSGSSARRPASAFE